MPLPALSIDAGRAEHAAHAPCLAARVEPCNVRPAGFPAAKNGLSCPPVLLHFLHYFYSSIPSSGTEKAPRLQMQGAPNMRHARLALRLHPRNVTNRRSDTLVLLHFLHYSHSFNPSPNTEKAPRHHALTRGSSGKTRTYNPSVNSRMLCH